jgi:acetyl-CoA acetyltransferase family protein
MDKAEVLIVGGARTPMSTFQGSLKDVSAIELGVLASQGAFRKAGVNPEWIDQTVFGNVLQTSADAIYLARHIGLKSGVPLESPALTVNRLCGSGMQAAISAGQLIRLGEAQFVLAGGTESMSQAPFVIRGARSGIGLGRGALEDSLWECLVDRYCGFSMGLTAENVAQKYAIAREAQDCWALRSQHLAARAWDEGRLGEEVVPVEIRSRKQTDTVSRDDHFRRDTSIDGLARLAPVFKKDGCVTAGNASGIADGAAALLLASKESSKRYAVEPLGRLVEWAVVGVDPAYMGIGPVPAVRQVLTRAGLTLADIDLFEINEAFAGQYLAVEKDLGLCQEKVNVNGGAIALGHPLGMTGARLLLTLLLELRRRGQTRGLAAACIGGGQGIAAIVEVV